MHPRARNREALVRKKPPAFPDKDATRSGELLYPVSKSRPDVALWQGANLTGGVPRTICDYEHWISSGFD